MGATVAEYSYYSKFQYGILLLLLAGCIEKHYHCDKSTAWIVAGKCYITRGGEDVRIYATDGGNQSPIHGAIRDGTGWYPFKWKSDGTFSSVVVKSDYDIMEEKECK